MENWTAENYLAHHGILGMKWGHQNGPPYPLGSGDHSASEKKAGWRKSLDGGSGDSLSRRQRKRLKKQLYKNAKRRIDQEVDEYGRDKEEPKKEESSNTSQESSKTEEPTRADKNLDEFGRPIKKPSSDTADSNKADTIKGIATAAATAAGLGIGAKVLSDQKKFGTDGSPRRDVRDIKDDDELKRLNQRAAAEQTYNKLYSGKSDAAIAKDLVDKSSQGLSQISKNIDDTVRSRPEYARMNLEGLSNKDLQDAITRENLEIQYSKLFNKQPQITKGEKRVKDVLDVAGKMLAATATALGIAVTVKELKRNAAGRAAAAVLHSEIQNDFSSEDYLAHHGILGQKWGHQNGPPYPLGSGDHSASERKAGWRKSLSDGRADRLKKKKKKLEDEIEYLKKNRPSMEEAADDVYSYVMTERDLKNKKKKLDKASKTLEERPSHSELIEKWTKERDALNKELEEHESGKKKLSDLEYERKMEQWAELDTEIENATPKSGHYQWGSGDAPKAKSKKSAASEIKDAVADVGLDVGHGVNNMVKKLTGGHVESMDARAYIKMFESMKAGDNLFKVIGKGIKSEIDDTINNFKLVGNVLKPIAGKEIDKDKLKIYG